MKPLGRITGDIADAGLKVHRDLGRSKGVSRGAAETRREEGFDLVGRASPRPPRVQAEMGGET
jgi:hypothetical protein